MGDVVDFKSKNSTKDAISFLKAIVKGLEDGSIPAIKTGVLMMLHGDDTACSFGFGSHNDDFNMLAVIECCKFSLMLEICGD